VVTYVKGDATKPQGDGPKIIAHICNDSGAWGAGFVRALSKMSPRPADGYRRMYNYHTITMGAYFIPLGTTQLVEIEADELYVLNMVAQHGTVSKLNPHPISYRALELALNDLAVEAQRLNATVHMPRIGAGLAQGKWEVIESIINRTLTLWDIDVTVYDL
jgi:O-acetyl-ADP-ribose deacetylase (regulator of RNase III)